MADTGQMTVLNEFRPIIFPSGNGSDDSPSARVWVELYRSEPALIEASMSISTGRYPKGLDPGRSDVHAYRAMKMVNRRLQNIETGIGDGVLAAVFTLSFREVHLLLPSAWSILTRTSGDDGESTSQARSLYGPLAHDETEKGAFQGGYSRLAIRSHLIVSSRLVNLEGPSG